MRCFVVGCARSGTTLLGVTLDRHSLLAMTPETGFYQEVAPLLHSSSAADIELVLARWPRLPELGLTAQDVFAQCSHDFRPPVVLKAILTLFAQSKGKPFCGEKTPIHRNFVSQLLQDFPAARVLHIFRDGRDVALSLLEVPWWGRGLQQAADLWMDAVKDIAVLQAEFPTRFLAVKFEDLATSPEACLDGIMAFLGLEFEASQLDPNVPSGVVLPRSMLWKGRALASIDAGRSGRWRHGLTREQRAFLNDQMGAQLSMLDYR